MLIVIGDIHGLFDPLKYLLSSIENSYYSFSKKKNRYIFLGDYIDYGPNSKEVIDLLLSLEGEKIFLAGNHDDAFLQYLIPENRDDNFTEKYWLRDLEGYRTMESFFWKKRKEDFLCEEVKNKLKLNAKYMNFFKNMKYIHTEKIGGQDFIFSHSSVDDNKLVSIDTLLELDTYEKYYEFHKKTNISVAHLQLWYRKDCNYTLKSKEFEKIKDYVVVHGHTVVNAIDGIPEIVKKNKLPLLEAGNDYKIEQTEKAVYINDRDIYKLDVSLNDIYGINIDTGVAYGSALTAMIIKENDLSELDFIQVKLDRPNKNLANIDKVTFKLKK